MPRRADAPHAPAPCERAAARRRSPRRSRCARRRCARRRAVHPADHRGRAAPSRCTPPRSTPSPTAACATLRGRRLPHVADPRLVRRDRTACLPLRQPLEGAVRVARAHAPGAADAPGTLSSRRAPHGPPRRPGRAARAAAPSVAQRMPLLTSLASVKAERDHLPQLLSG
ncbi:hypothetical protein FGB62_95g068 [Gracilaria domingensis]|nr:hypothetical protein FGB62_95g068 [Gracilaria domingensis]